MILVAISILFIAIYIFSVGFLFLCLSRPSVRNKGDFVAEVWLRWEICAGSTMYRKNFKTQRAAHIFAKLYAIILDGLLPRVYFSEGWGGGLIKNKYEYGISYGVRKMTEAERNGSFYRIYSTYLPGTDGFSGEHASVHPLIAASEKLGGSPVFMLPKTALSPCCARSYPAQRARLGYSFPLTEAPSPGPGYYRRAISPDT